MVLKFIKILEFYTFFSNSVKFGRLCDDCRFVTSDTTRTESELHVTVDLRVMIILELVLKTILYYYCLIVYTVEYDIRPPSYLHEIINEYNQLLRLLLVI